MAGGKSDELLTLAMPSLTGKVAGGATVSAVGDVGPDGTPGRRTTTASAKRETLTAMSYRIGLAVVGTFLSTTDAEVAKGLLAAVGVDALIRSDNAGGMYPALDAAELLVRTEDAAKAKDVLARASHAPL